MPFRLFARVRDTLTRLLLAVFVSLAPGLRALGLDFINKLVEKCRSNRKEEPKKVLTGSPWYAAGRILVHVLPMTVLVGLIWINYGHYYIGPTFIMDPEQNTVFLAGIQICAKLEELLCIASLASIVLQALRHELLGDGIPIGLLGSGIWFSSISAFWSPDFLGSVGWRGLSWSRIKTLTWLKFWRWRLSWPEFSWPTLTGIKAAWKRQSKFRFYLLLIVCGLLAATIGPASAILMLPREQDVPSGAISFYLNGSANTFWPDTVTAYSEPDYCALANATVYPICPSSGYQSLRSTLTRFNYENSCSRSYRGGWGVRFAPLCQARLPEGNREWSNFLVQTPYNLLPPVLNNFKGPVSWKTPASTAMQPHAATIAYMHQIRDDWPDAAEKFKQVNKREDKWTYELKTRGTARSPYVRVHCTRAQNLTADADTAFFPYMHRKAPPGQDPKTDFTSWATNKSTSISQLNRTYSSHLRTQWLPLPMEEFGDVYKGYNTTGLLVELPWLDSSRVGIGCAVAAAWHNTTIRSERSTSYDAWSIALTAYDWDYHDDSPDADVSNTPVTLDRSWLEMLTPPGSGPDALTGESTLNTLESILTDTYIPSIPDDIKSNPSLCGDQAEKSFDSSMSSTEVMNYMACDGLAGEFIQDITAIMVADGLSRYQSHIVVYESDDLRSGGWYPVALFNASDVFTKIAKAPVDYGAQDLANQTMTVYAFGYAYYPSTNADYLALSGVCVYLAVALLHIIYTMYGIARQKRGTSNSWDSVTELLVLCQNSPPPAVSHKLDNTSAGIGQLETYNSVVRVRAREDEHGKHKLRLVLDDDFPHPASSVAMTSVSYDRTKAGSIAVSGIELGSIAAPASTTTLLSRSSSQTPDGSMVVKDKEYA